MGGSGKRSETELADGFSVCEGQPSASYRLPLPPGHGVYGNDGRSLTGSGSGGMIWADMG
jgi:hypothetical protein